MTGQEVAQPLEASHESVAAIQRALTAIARRGRARSRAHAPQLSLVDQSLLDYLHDHPDSRAADIAVHYLLDKSTVSRQLPGSCTPASCRPPTSSTPGARRCASRPAGSR